MRKTAGTMKRVRKTKHRPPQSRHQQAGSGIAFWFVIIFVLAGVPFGLGKYIEFNSPGPFDSASNVYSAKRIVDGARIGIEERPSAATGTLIVNIIGVRLFGFSETGPKLIQGILQAAALILMFWVMRRLFGTTAAAVGVIIASVYLSAPLIAKFGNVKEQYMIAFMVLGISCYVLGQLDGRWWMTLLAGGMLSWAPLFKETGYSSIAAVGLFVVAQPFFKNRTWKRTATDTGLLLTGAVIAMAPLYVWILAGGHHRRLPYSFVWKQVTLVFTDSKSVRGYEPSGLEFDEDATQDKDTLLGRYVVQSWRVLTPEQRKEVVFRILRYYRLLILPIALALGSIVARLIRLFWVRPGSSEIQTKKDCERFVLLFAVWWLLDMAFVWVSPRSYEQYYLPLNASAAMLGGYLIATYRHKLKTTLYKPRWVVIGLAGLMLMIVMLWHIFFGIETSPHSGTKYGQRRRGYLQQMDAIAKQGTATGGVWQFVGRYIRENSRPDEKIYVWGWVPGIYLEAQRFSSAPKAFESDMHRKSPQELADAIKELLTVFEKEPPRFIVDTYKRHFPWDRPPLELWPVIRNRIAQELGARPADSEKVYAEWLSRNFGEDEAKRYEEMRPFRIYVMKNYNVVRPFGEMLLFRLRDESAQKGQQ